MFTIVIVDDEYLEREVIKKIIQGIDGSRVVGEGNSGRIAIELCTALKPQLVIINCHMGGISGLEAARQIRHQDPTIRILMTSADNSLPLRRDFSDIGIQEFLLKPIPPKTIEQVIQKYMQTTTHQTVRYNKKAQSLNFYPPELRSKEIASALLYIDTHYREEITLESVSEVVFLSSYYFSRLFKKEVGFNFSSYLLYKRIDEAKRLLAESEDSISNISASVSFKDQSYFCKVFKKHVGQTPKEYRLNTKNEQNDRQRVLAMYVNSATGS